MNFISAIIRLKCYSVFIRFGQTYSFSYANEIRSSTYICLVQPSYNPLFIKPYGFP